MNKLWWWIGGAGILAFVVWILVATSGQPTTTSSTTDIKLPAVTSSDFQTGPSSAKVTMIEYADFQCPGCAQAYPVIKRLQSDYGNRLNFVYRMFPLENIHQNAESSARAAYAANLQGKFWEMHDMLFANQTKWEAIQDPTDTYVGYAKDLGLNTDQFKKDFTSQKAKDFVQNSYSTALNLGLQGTPTIFVNGKGTFGLSSYDDLKKQIETSLKGS